MVATQGPGAGRLCRGRGNRDVVGKQCRAVVVQGGPGDAGFAARELDAVFREGGLDPVVEFLSDHELPPGFRHELAPDHKARVVDVESALGLEGLQEVVLVGGVLKHLEADLLEDLLHLFRVGVEIDGEVQFHDHPVEAYAPLGENGALALGATACRASRDAPFFNLCGVGITDQLRGFSAGQYLDNALLSAQAELRYRLGGRFGVAAFAGASRTGADFSDLGPTVSAGGFGVRFRSSKSFPLDFSVDQTVNDAGDSYTYVYIGQSF